MFVDALAHETPKTKDAKEVIGALAKVDGFDKLATKRANAALIAGIGIDENTVKSYRNFGNMYMEEVRNLNPANILKYKYLVLVGADDAVKEIAARAGKKTKSLRKAQDKKDK